MLICQTQCRVRIYQEGLTGFPGPHFTEFFLIVVDLVNSYMDEEDYSSDDDTGFMVPRHLHDSIKEIRNQDHLVPVRNKI